ncbi:hypothetical protein Barb4_01271 [Bacteroidales bacterium Barb4]|nr:hypothetical protein Barb4_01271 [Bacteroidales bacterium Barb4]
MPDFLFISKDGQTVASEVELHMKSKPTYYTSGDDTSVMQRIGTSINNKLYDAVQ